MSVSMKQNMLQHHTEFVFAIESPSTDFARIRPFPRVDHLMTTEVILLREGSATDFAAERLVPRVSPHVIQQLAAVTESRATYLTGARFFTVSHSNVDPHTFL